VGHPVLDGDVLVELLAWFLRHAVALRRGVAPPPPTKVVNVWRRAVSAGVLPCAPERALRQLLHVRLRGVVEEVSPALAWICSGPVYAAHMAKARARAVPADDVPYFALAMALDAPIWTKDLTDLAGCRHPVWTTAYVHLAFGER
jgi:transposase